MSILVECSDCGANLRVADGSAGKHCKCPNCGRILAIPDAPDDSNGIAAAPASRMDLGGKRSAARAAEADRAPRTKSIVKKGDNRSVLLAGGAALLLILGFGGLLVLGACGGGAWWYFARSARKEAEQQAAANKPKPPPPFWEGADAVFFPNDVRSIEVTRVDQIRGSALYKDVRGEMGALFMDLFEQELESNLCGVRLADVDYIVAAAVTQTPPNSVVIVRTKRVVLADDISANFKRKRPAANYTTSKVGEKTIYEINNVAPFDQARRLSFCIADNEHVIVSDAANLRAILQRGKAPELPDDLKNAIRAGDLDKQLANAEYDKDGLTQFSGVGVLAIGFLPKLGTEGAFPGNKVRPVSMASTVAVESDLQVTNVLLFKDATAAAGGKTKMETNLEEMRRNPTYRGPPELLNFKMTLDGNKLVVEQNVPGPVFVKLLRAMLNVK